MLTLEQKAVYLLDPTECPFCRSANVQQMERSYGAQEILDSILCNHCHKQWTEVYKLVDVEEENE